MELEISEKDESLSIPTLNRFTILPGTKPKIQEPAVLDKVPPKLDKVPPPKKQISYDTILSSMSMQLVNGKLQLVRNPSIYQEPIPPKQVQPQYQNQYQYQNQRQNQQQQQKPPRQPLTEEQKAAYKKHQILQYIQQQRERRRIQQTKSKQLLFSNQHSSKITTSLNSPYMTRFQAT